MANINDPVKKILISEDQIKERITQIAEEISTDYKDKKVLLVSVLTGSFIFVADLIRKGADVNLKTGDVIQVILVDPIDVPVI